MRATRLRENFGNSRVQVFTAGGALLAVFGGRGTGNGQFSAPIGAAVMDGGVVSRSTVPDSEPCATTDPAISVCESCLRDQCCADTALCVEPDACAIGGPDREGELSCMMQCLQQAFYNDESLIDARAGCETVCSAPAPLLSQTTTALLDCMVGSSSGCDVACLGARYE